MKNRYPQHSGRSGLASIRAGLCTITICAFAIGHASAQNLTWTGVSGSNWNDIGNWIDGSDPSIPADFATLTFSGTPSNSLTNNDLTDLTTGNISFTNAGPFGTAPNNVTTPFTLVGNAIIVGGNISTSAVIQTGGTAGIDITDTIATPVIFNGTRTINTVRAGGTTSNRVSHNLTISGLITESGGSQGLSKSGDADLTLSNGSNSFTGPLAITGGGAVQALHLQAGGAASSIGSGTAINFSGGILRFTGSVAPIAAIDRSINLTSTGTGGGTIENNGSAAITFNGAFTNTGTGAKSFILSGSNTGSNVFASPLANSQGGGVLSLDKVSGGVWALAGNNSFTGNILIDGGTLRMATIANIGSNSNLGAGNQIQIGRSSRTATLEYTGTGSTTNRQVKLGGFVGTTASGNSIILASSANGGTGLKFTATDFNTLEATVPAQAITRILFLGGDNTDPNEISGAIRNGNSSLTTALHKSGAGLWVLSGQNTHSGVATSNGSGGNIITAGTLQVNQATGGLGDATAANTINMAGGTLSLRNDGTGNNSTIIYGSISNTAGYNVQLTVPANTINVDNLTSNTGNTIQLGVLSSTGNRALNVTGANAYSLAFTSLSLSTGTGQNTTLNPTSAKITISGNVTNPMENFGPANFDTLTLGGTSSGNRIQGAISDAVGSSATLGGFTRVTKSGTSTWELTGTNTHSGIGSVTEGLLLINGDSSGATGTITVSGGTLGGSGSIGGAVTVAAAGSLAPGNNAVGTLTLVSNLTVTAQATGTGKLSFELGNPANSDQIAVGGTFAIGVGLLGFSDFNFSPVAGLTNGTYPLITGAASLTGSLNASDLTGIFAGGLKEGTLQFNGTTLELVVTDAGADPYTTWSGGAPFDGDANADGVENGQAWFLGATDPNAPASGLLPKATQTAGALVMEFDCLDTAARGAAAYQVQYGNNLTTWAGTDIPGAVGTFTAGVVDFVVTDPAPAGGLLKVVATIPVSEAGAGRLFGRLNGVK